MKMGKYGEALGFWELRIGGANLNLKPKKGDNLKLLYIMAEAKKRNDESWMFEQMVEFLKVIISRDYPPQNEEEELELDQYLELNMVELVKETLVSFRWTTKDTINKISEQEKKD